MEHLLFAAYLILFAWLVTKTKFFTASGLTTPQLVIIFLLKVMAGILYGWIGVYYGEMAQMVDTWGYHYESIKEWKLLMTDPQLFFTNIFHNGYNDGYTKFFAAENSWWNDLKGTFFVKTLAIMNVASQGNYYVNVIFYSFISMFGPIALYRVMNDVFPAKKLPILLSTFLVPSVLYWTSGVHKDGVIFVGLAFVIYHMYFGLKVNRFSFLRVLSILLGLVLVLALRNFMIIPVLPALFAWVLASKLKFRPVLVFASVYVLFILVFFTAKFLHPRLNMPEEVVARQEAFLGLGGGSAVDVKKLEPTFPSFVANAPQAFALSTIRPYPSDVKHLLSLAAAIEINFLLLLFVAFLFWRTNGKPMSPFLAFCLFFSFSVLMMIGYSVNILGAIVRYRSIVLSLLIIPMVAKTDWSRIGRLIFGNINNK
ncbi:MAG: hypothetical protein EON98_06435 [Chitinophagaceae bacterium]|nr:MAG: hypothetical protein EON98_06435 [Chitinophagaceae bacterium]